MVTIAGQKEPQEVIDMPNTDLAICTWISRGGNFDIDVEYEGNLAADRGDNQWDPIDERLVLFHGQGSRITESRLRAVDNRGLLSEKHSWRGEVSVARAVTNGVWDENPEADPRTYCYGYGGPGSLIDTQLTNTSYYTKLVGYQKLYGSPCALIESKNKYGRVDCWIDTEHDFIIRSMKIWQIAYPTTTGKFLPFSDTEIGEVQHIGEAWLPIKYVNNRYWTVTTPQGKTRSITVTTSDTFQKIQQNDPALKSAFVIHWPVDTLVEDYQHWKTYIMTDDGHLRDIHKRQ